MSLTMQRVSVGRGDGIIPLYDGSPADKSLFIAPYDLVVKGIRYTHSTAGSDGGAVTVQVVKMTGVQAPGDGAAMLATPFDAKGTALTVQSGALTGTSANLQLNAGDRLGLDYTGTLTALAGVQVTIVYEKV
jgi:hypothetical protein